MNEILTLLGMTSWWTLIWSAIGILTAGYLTGLLISKAITLVNRTKLTNSQWESFSDRFVTMHFKAGRQWIVTKEEHNDLLGRIYDLEGQVASMTPKKRKKAA